MDRSRRRNEVCLLVAQAQRNDDGNDRAGDQREEEIGRYELGAV